MLEQLKFVRNKLENYNTLILNKTTFFIQIFLYKKSKNKLANLIKTN